MRNLDTFVRSHQTYVRSTLCHLGVPPASLDDAQQDVLLVLVRRRSAFDPSRGSARQWVWGICRNVAAARHRTARLQLARRSTHEANARPPIEERIAARQCLDTLDPDARSLWLARQEGCTAAELAGQLRVPVTTVQWRLRQVRERLQRWAVQAARECRCLLADLRRGLGRWTRGCPGAASTVVSGTLLCAHVAAAAPVLETAGQTSTTVTPARTMIPANTYAPATPPSQDTRVPSSPPPPAPPRTLEPSPVPTLAAPTPTPIVRTQPPRVRRVRAPKTAPSVPASGRVIMGDLSVEAAVHHAPSSPSAPRPRAPRRAL